MSETERKLGYEYEEGAKYVAYVSSYTQTKDQKYGIRIYDVDMEKGYLYEKKQVEITNSSYVSYESNTYYDYDYSYSYTPDPPAPDWGDW